ncbi:hypothetical protein SLH46_18770 [Draconibacterium sp. IB214405]|uniref:hypothetical protein n=1 Tax=Draconibacterium sp. IB214405 TaxID=3097352 RepID=UPI002A1265CD|nr:hypothetical protein [Draconibacterium sp. IB214405]MDX8341250.1 hypothetical protein [Draconibacterium sp. IB214405]
MKTRPRLTVVILICSVLFGFIAACHIFIDPTFRKQYTDYNTFVHESPVEPGYLKVHYKDGKVVVFDSWKLSSGQDSLIGNGKLFDLKRNIISDGLVSTGTDQIAIIETNQLTALKDKTNERIAALSILAGIDAVIGVVCITVPKACFGSCPTFYLTETNNVHWANAEAFSSSIAPSMEQPDIDALRVKVGSGDFRLIMKNEALETHVVNEVQIVAAEVEKDAEILHGVGDKFFHTKNITNCISALTDGENIAPFLNAVDGNEYFSLSDSLDLGAKEEILLEFNNNIKNTPGIILNFRQTLLTTFLLYNGMSYMGDEIGDYFAKIETSDMVRKKLKNPFSTLGGIKVFAFDSKKEKWDFITEIYETGPIAPNHFVVPFSETNDNGDPIRVKLEMTKGMWRLDYAGLADIDKEINPAFIYPSEILKDNLPDPEALTEISCDDEDYLISMPGDEWHLHFDLPQPNDENNRYQLFLSAKGYYLEWIRNDWLEEKDPERLKNMLLNDKATWRELAIEYKTYESQMEELFWNSKYENNQ